MERKLKAQVRKTGQTIFELPFEVLSGVNTLRKPVASSDTILKKKFSVINPEEARFLCKTCAISFENSELQRHHFTKRIHALNLKKHRPIFLDSDVSDVESDFSDDSLLSVGIEDLTDKEARTSQFVPLRKIKKKIYLGYKNIFLIKDEELVLPTGKVAVILQSGGHFTCAIFRLPNFEVLASKGFHRYIIRKKQGKMQSNKDNSGRRAKSAGATLRRYNELEFKKDIKELIQIKFKDHWKDCSKIFVQANVFFKKYIMDIIEGEKINKNNVERIPFSSGRPTLKEAKDIVDKLFNIYVVLDEAKPLNIDKIDSVESTEPVNKVEKTKRKEKNGHEFSTFALDVLQKCAAGCNFPIFSTFSKEQIEDLKNVFDDEGRGLLHYCCMSGESSSVSCLQDLLRLEFNPEKETFFGKTAYQLLLNNPPKMRKEKENCFLKFRSANSARWNYAKARIPVVETKEEKLKKLERKKEKNRRKRERKKQNRTAMEASKVLTSSIEKLCENKKCKLAPTSKDVFHAGGKIFCSSACVREHKRALMLAATLKRSQK
eukprot:snap_masked-scaffold_15-processed-gene-2.64-mRNA-1 protein AED:1.00 eAED:1.00 QI:0/-1/0/0/-1/1/1/0/545